MVPFLRFVCLQLVITLSSTSGEGLLCCEQSIALSKSLHFSVLVASFVLILLTCQMCVLLLHSEVYAWKLQQQKKMKR